MDHTTFIASQFLEVKIKQWKRKEKKKHEENFLKRQKERATTLFRCHKKMK